MMVKLKSQVKMRTGEDLSVLVSLTRTENSERIEDRYHREDQLSDLDHDSDSEGNRT